MAYTFYTSDTYHYLLRLEYNPRPVQGTKTWIKLEFDEVNYIVNDFGYIECEHNSVLMAELLRNMKLIQERHHTGIKQISQYLESTLKNEIAVAVVSGKILAASFYANGNYVCTANMSCVFPEDNETTLRNERIINDIFGVTDYKDRDLSKIQLVIDNLKYKSTFDNFTASSVDKVYFI